MQTDHSLLPRLLLVSASLLALPASAASIFINAPDRIGAPVTTVAGAKIRSSPTNWDQSLDAGGGTYSGNFIQANLSNSFSSPGRTYSFTLENRPGQGLIFRTVEGSKPAVTLAWGTFSPKVTGLKVVPTIHDLPPPGAFNLLNIEALADRRNSSVTWSNLLFTAPSLTVGGGAFTSGSVNQSTGPNFQTLIGDTNLAAQSWKLTGTVNLLRGSGNGAGGDENVRFVIHVQNAPFLAHAPEPGTAALAFAALGGLVMRRRRIQ